MFGTAFNAVDIGVLVLIFLEMLIGLRRGMASELYRLLATTATAWIALVTYTAFAAWLVQHSRLADDPDLAAALAFLLIVLGLAVVFWLMRLLIALLMQLTFNDKINRAGGGLLGLLRGTVLASLILFAVGLWPYPQVHELFVANSLVGRAVFQYSPRVIEKIRPAAPGQLEPTPRPLIGMDE